MSLQSLTGPRATVTTITFDCYGTLVDWERGLRAAIRTIARTDEQAVFDAYLEIEAQVEAEPPYRRYREVLAETLRRLADKFRFRIPPEHRDLLATTLPDWPLWPDTNPALSRLKRRYRLGVLSNVDRDLFAGTAAKFAVELDLLVTAEDVHSYKPSHMHFLRAIGEIGGDGSHLLHVAESLFHDSVPASRMGINNVWINRRHQTRPADARPIAEFPDLLAFATAMGV